MIKELMSDKVPNLPNYENFMKATNKSTVFILAFMNFFMEMNRVILKRMEEDGIKFEAAPNVPAFFL